MIQLIYQSNMLKLRKSKLQNIYKLKTILQLKEVI